MFRKLWRGTLDLVFPPICLLCQKSLKSKNPRFPVCELCHYEIRLNKPPFCAKCSRPHADPGGTICPECLKTKPAFDIAWGCCEYTEPMKKLVHLFKYNQKTSLQYYFHEQVCRFIDESHPRLFGFELLMPVPLHSARLRERGYNQSELLARRLSEKFHINISARNLVRTKHTHHQALLSQKERWTNVRGAFKIKHSSEIKNQNVLLFDDLLTTGATASEAALALKSSGAKKVGLLTLAIAGSHNLKL